MKGEFFVKKRKNKLFWNESEMRITYACAALVVNWAHVRMMMNYVITNKDDSYTK